MKESYLFYKMKQQREWFVTAPWGKIALVSWGNPAGEPILLVHGRQDSVASFKPLLELLPDKYHYVGFDLPGHGRSDAFPVGVKLMRFHFVTALEVVLEHLGWRHFVFMAHSMGTQLGLFYNAIHPHRITKLIFLDPGPAMQYLMLPGYVDFYKVFDNHYSNYGNYITDDRVYSQQRAVEAVMRARDLTEEQARLVLERNLVEVGLDRYRLSWDKRLKLIPPLYLPYTFYVDLFSKNLPPALIIAASRTKKGLGPVGKTADRIIAAMQSRSCEFHIKSVDGGHDVHLTNPDRFSEDVCSFLDGRSIAGAKSKL